VVDFAKFGPIERVEVSRIRRISGPALSRNWVTIPHVTNQEDADITDLEAFRVQLNKENEKSGLKLTMLAFLIKACVAALKKFPDFNSSIDPEGGAIIRKNYWHIGFAADTPQGLVVPVVKDADKKGVFEIAQETSALAAKARDGKLGPSDMQGGTFSISSLGGIGGTSLKSPMSGTLTSIVAIVVSPLHQHAAQIAHGAGEVRVEPRRRRAVDHAVIPRQRQRQDEAPRRGLAVGRHLPPERPAHAEDCDLRRVDDRCE
jgi:pyruvate dehydrogenase E2 component (dihydrolipoamide acetyltransferase)